MIASTRIRFAYLLLVCLIATACADGWRRPQKQPGSALWIGARTEALNTSSTTRLKENGVGELFLEVARLDPDSPEPVVRLETTEVSPSTVTLVVGGKLEGVSEPQALAEQIHPILRELRFDVEGKGLVPAGYHFDLRTVDDLTSLAQFLRAFRKKAERSLFVSVSLPRSWLEREGLADVIKASDVIVPFLYGQRVYEREDAAAWDFLDLQRQLERLEDYGKPYLLGVVTLGTASHLGKQGRVKARTTRMSLQEIIWNRQLEVAHGFSLDGVNRRVYSLDVNRKTTIGKWELEPGDGVRVVRGSTSDLEELQRLLGAWGLEHHLGQVYFRLPREGEELSLQLDNLWNALDPTPAEPDLQLEVSVQRRSGRGWIFRFGITNLNGEITELSLLDNNYLQVTARQGTFFREASLGDFFRYDLGLFQEDGSFRRALKSDTIRLHAPILEGDQQIQSGNVELLYTGGNPVLDLTASFLLPDGRTLEYGPYTWQDGSLEDGRDRE